jgi:hypothetical protein
MRKQKICVKNIKDVAKVAQKIYNEDSKVCFLSVPGCEEDIVIRRDDSISSEAVTNYYPQMSVYEIVLGKNKDNCIDETMHELSHIYRGHLTDKQLNMENFIRQEIEAWLDSSFLVQNRNILASGQWLVGIGNKAMETYSKNSKQVVKTMRKVVDNIVDLKISEREWDIVEKVLNK